MPGGRGLKFKNESSSKLENYSFTTIKKQGKNLTKHRSGQKKRYAQHAKKKKQLDTIRFIQVSCEFFDTNTKPKTQNATLHIHFFFFTYFVS
jgi:DNA replication protein DnaC